jgi:predicted HicB family RNase H-like nuclease
MKIQKKAATKRRRKGTDASQSGSSMADRAEAALREAKKLKQDRVSWIDGNNKLFGPEGILSRLFPTRSERAQFTKTIQSKQILEILDTLPEPKSGSIKRRSETSGRILARVPRSIHSALLAEAEAEGVSLNQLLVSKLSMQLRAAV